MQQQLEGEPAFRALEKIDRLAVYEDFIRELEAKDEQVKQKEKEGQRLALALTLSPTLTLTLTR